ncbi:hypothetical protein LTR85_010644 [Meristemomyces frigidus]|nr:hypothetical protein LTR85_010644 [Meristemomyces frigidus]
MPGVLTHDSSHDSSTNLAKAFAGSNGNANASRRSSELLRRESSERPTPAIDGIPGGWPHTPMGMPNGSMKEGIGGRDGSILSVPNGTSERAPSAKSLALSTRTRRSSGFENEKKSGEVVKEETPRPGAAEEGYFSIPNGKPAGPSRSPLAKPPGPPNGDVVSSTPNRSVSATLPMTPSTALPPVEESSPAQPSRTGAPLEGMLKPPGPPHHHRASSPPAFTHTPASPPISGASLSPSPSRPDRLSHRHTLEVPKVNTRTSADGRDVTSPTTDGIVSATGRFSPNTPTKRRGSLQLARRVTRSLHSHSDMQLDQVPQDEDAARWAELVKAKRASRRNRVDTDDDRVVVGTKVDEKHENFIRAYNMLTGIRFCVSRIHAKMDRELTDADFGQAQKYSFDITGGELTPSAKYDFKFKDYAPWVFRHIRSSFSIDPAEYLVSLTAKYILSELGSPGKSGSFFYFSRDYKYIIKTIHHGEHKFLRKILRDYYLHIRENPDTLLSQFYGLHRVKLPYGKKVHFVVMNNLFPPHRDIHRTFDLKGSTIGRDFREEDLEKNPRATLKDLNWLRRNLHLEFGPTKKEAFVSQMQRDVALLQRLKIMDYSLLVGIHDLERGNEENLRDKTLQVFQPGSAKPNDPQMGQLARTPSKMESVRRARELRESVKKERPVPMGQTLDKMPDVPHRKGFYFYQDDGGFQATHEDDTPGEEIYYLGIIDCLTRYNYVKKAEHLWKGMGGHDSQISPIPPDRYGDRFVRFISGITMSRERAEKERLSQTLEQSSGLQIPEDLGGTINDPHLGGVNLQRDPANPAGTEKVMEKAMREVERSKKHGASEAGVPERSITSIRDGEQSPAEASTLPVIGEAAENASTTSRTPSKVTPKPSHEELAGRQPVLGNANMPSDSVGEVPPPTPPKLGAMRNSNGQSLRRESWGGGPPPTPPKDDRRGRFMDKDLPLPPVATHLFSASPSRMDEEMERASAKVHR